MKKKNLADWWEETHGGGKRADASRRQESVEALYEKLGDTPAVDASTEVIRKEMAAVYRDMRCGRIDCHDGTRLAYVLDLLRKSHETTAMQERLGAVEKAMGLKGESSPDWLGIPFDDGGE